MSKYITKTDDPQNRVTVDIFVKTFKNGFRVLSRGEEGTLNPSLLPEDIIKESSTWVKKLPFGVSTMIDDESIVEIPNQRIGEPPIVKRDLGKLYVARMKYLLKDWTLHNSDPELALKFVTIPGKNIQVIDPSLLRFIEINVDESIITEFLSRYYLKTIHGEDEDKEKN